METLRKGYGLGPGPEEAPNLGHLHLHSPRESIPASLSPTVPRRKSSALSTISGGDPSDTKRHELSRILPGHLELHHMLQPRSDATLQNDKGGASC